MQRIYQDLVIERQFAGSYFAVRRFAVRLLGKRELPFRRMECAPGQELQVHFGQGAWVVENGKRRRPHFFRAVLSCSRKGYSEVAADRHAADTTCAGAFVGRVLALAVQRFSRRHRVAARTKRLPPLAAPARGSC